MKAIEPRLPRDALQSRCFRRAIGEDGLQNLFNATPGTAVMIKPITQNEVERVIVDDTVYVKAVTQPYNSRLQAIAEQKVAIAAMRSGLALTKTLTQEGKAPMDMASGNTLAMQLRRVRTTAKRQRTNLGASMRKAGRNVMCKPKHLPRAVNWLASADPVSSTRSEFREGGPRKSVTCQASTHPFHPSICIAP